ncbi:uncharacterized protein LOC129336922 [Eublepharis macularius]|uniref:Uncharacterized protein LOC129336922 n=1 Tax=Eublepharis macularius TaxID=481883 RepID=A0AA97K020_EUBMA|nr:uncharacterized protein LOC129336922 [Eublepharis macularius]
MAHSSQPSSHSILYQSGRAGLPGAGPAESGTAPDSPSRGPPPPGAGPAARRGGAAAGGSARPVAGRSAAQRPEPLSHSRPRPELRGRAGPGSRRGLAQPASPAGKGEPRLVCRPLGRRLSPGPMPRRRAVRALARLCLENVAAHMGGLWAKDYAERRLDELRFRFVMGPFEELAGSLIQELIQLLGESHRLTRVMLHLLLVPHLTELSLRACPKLASAAIAQMISVRCKNLSLLDLQGCSRIPSDTLVDLLEGLPCLTKLGLSETQCDTRVLSAVACSCSRLRELAASNCSRLSPASLLHLAYSPTSGTLCCPMLQVLSVDGLEPAGHSQDLVLSLAFVLLALPSLRFLSHHLVSKALSLIHSQQMGGAEIAPGFPSLAELAQGRRTCQAAPEHCRILLPLKRLAEVDEPLLPAVSAVCPDLVEVTVLLGESPGLGRWLRSWETLTHLTLNCVGSRSLGEFVPAMAGGLGAQLQSLSLGYCFFDDELSFHALLSHCPNLRTFSASLIPAMAWESDDGQPAHEAWQQASTLRPQEFPELRAFSLIFAPNDRLLSSQKAVVLSSSIVSLLRHSPLLETLDLVCLPFSLDEVFERVLEPPGAALRHLRQLSLSQSEVSPRTVRQLLSSDNQLHLLNLGGCPGIHRRHYCKLLRVVSQEGLELDITWD